MLTEQDSSLYNTGRRYYDAATDDPNNCEHDRLGSRKHRSRQIEKKCCPILQRLSRLGSPLWPAEGLSYQ